MKKYFMGIDIGTQESKGVIIDENCELIAKFATKHGLSNPKPRYYEHDAEKIWWNDLCIISKELLKMTGIPNTQIAGFGASCLGSDCLPVDENCTPLRPAILYGIDTRATEEVKEITAHFGEKRIIEIFGRPMTAGDQIARVLWIKKNEPEVYNRTYKFITGSTFLTAKLTGKFFIDAYLSKAYHPIYTAEEIGEPDFLSMICRRDQVADIREANEVVGTVTAKAAAETGLAEGTPVITGMDDAVAESVSTGVIVPGKSTIMLGTSCCLYACTDKPFQDPQNRFPCIRYVVPGTYSFSGATNNAGGMSTWLRDKLYPETIQKQQETGKNAFDIMLEGLDDIPAGSDGLIALPYFSGERTPLNDPLARGVLFGLTLNHTRDHIHKAILEGVSMGIAVHYDIMEEIGVDVEEIRVVGGGTKNPIWLQILADCIGKPVHTAKVTIGASYGDAITAALATGVYKDYADLYRVIKPGKTIEPIPANVAKYNEIKPIFHELYAKTKDLMHKLS
ncbi:FGGY-family carbohydrate kinase [Feifania hominis]|uniref:FGGY-family carbohydrate kinase n=1 Tax=Feifania hominis TaxID=2763660 RepID=A0A926HPY6_9FIRM|nr:FGGY-family carbohydrate kinase [Feifania hominis]MBC8535772.1 FGGY-family carbohydrate kinase [Feifania hominis]